MNFIEYFEKIVNEGEKNIKTGINGLDFYINGIQRKTIYSVGAAPKVGKTTFVDYCFWLYPFINEVVQKNNENIKWFYFSYEIDKIRKIFKILPFFIYYDYKIYKIKINGEEYLIDYNLLSGRKLDKNGNKIKIPNDLKEIVLNVYNKRIKKLFEKTEFFEEKTNPTGIRNILLTNAMKNGQFLYEDYEIIENGQKIKKKKLIGYKPNNENEFIIVIIDHIRKLRKEREFDNKQVIDKMLEYEVELRNLLGYTFVNVAHINRNLEQTDRLKFAKTKIYPTSSDFKDSGNIAEESDVVITLFDPTDEKFMLTEHFGIDIKKYPNYRSVHIIENRDGEKAHIFTQMFPSVGIFKEIANTNEF